MKPSPLMTPVHHRIRDHAMGRGKPCLVLAPMEGVTDELFREVLTEIGEYEACFTEFLRVSHASLGKKSILSRLPELASGSSFTASQTPIVLQILGGNADFVSETAANALEMGVAGIDLNFGCPAPVVNRHDGGAALLKDLPRMEAIIKATRAMVTDPKVSFSIKMRLGWDDDYTCLEAFKRAVGAGVDFVTIHARTRMQGYSPPVKWPILGQVRELSSVPILASGDIWSRSHIESCAKESGLSRFMVARGALSRPNMTRFLEAEEEVLNINYLKIFYRKALDRNLHPGSILRKFKQWGSYAKKGGTLPQFDELKRIENASEYMDELERLTT